jgi:hypothetical protein
MLQGPDSTIFDIYRRLPVPLQNLACSLKGVEMRYQRYGKPFREFLDFLKKSEWWDRDDLQAYQNARLREIVRHAYESVPFYREEIKERGRASIRHPNAYSFCSLPRVTRQFEIISLIDGLSSEDQYSELNANWSQECKALFVT